MPAGLTVVGDHGNYQIDDSTYNLGLIAKGTVNFAGDSWEVYHTATLQFSGLETPVLALHVPSQNKINCWGIESVTLNNGVHTYKLGAATQIGYGEIWQGEWFLFDRPKPTPAGQTGYGLEVYDPQGRLKFSSANPPMRVMSPLGATEYPVGRKYAIPVQLSFNYRDQSDSLHNVAHEWTVEGGYIGGEQNNMPGWGGQLLSAGSGDASGLYPMTQGGSSIPIVLDVTGY